MFDEQPDGDPHGECAAEIANLRHLLGQCYAKLMKFGVENSDPFLMDELKLTLMQCYDEPYAATPAPTFRSDEISAGDLIFDDQTHNVKVSGPEAALSPEGRARLPGSAAPTNEAP